MKVIGIDGLDYSNVLITYRKYLSFLYELSQKYKTYILKVEEPTSPLIWTKVFSGEEVSWYTLYVKPIEQGNWRLIRRDEIPVKFIWDIKRVNVVNVPVVIPPYSNIPFKPVAYGLPFTVEECLDEVRSVTNMLRHRAKIGVYTVIDRIMHVTRDEGKLEPVFKALDEALKLLIRSTTKFIIVSDHGMIKISDDVDGEHVPRHDMPYIKTVTKRIHDHSDEAIIITNLDEEMKKHEDVFKVMMKYF